MNSAFETELRKRMGEDEAKLHEYLASPSAVPNYDTYRYLVGQLFYLRRLLESLDDINTTINNR